MTTRLLIARHGNTFNKGDVVTRVGGRTDLPLVTSGEQQGRDLGAYLAKTGLHPQAVFSGPLQRARRTAELACAAMGMEAANVKMLDIFNEIDYGPDENQPEEAVVARLGAAALDDWNKNAIVPDGWQVDPAAIIKGWQNFATDTLNNHAGKNVLVVTSNGIARFSPYLTGDFDVFAACHDIKVSTGALCVFENSGQGWVCTAWNLKPKDYL